MSKSGWTWKLAAELAAPLHALLAAQLPAIEHVRARLADEATLEEQRWKLQQELEAKKVEVLRLLSSQLRSPAILQRLQRLSYHNT